MFSEANDLIPLFVGLVIFCLSALVILFLVRLLKKQWVQSQPNEWLLVIRNGKLHKAGIGLKTFAFFTDSVVKFPSKVQRVSFNANNVTRQMQGVQITGFAFWSVNRSDEGPFKCYKYMESGEANDSVRTVCESVLRNLIANSSLQEVIKNRNHLRDSMSKELKAQFTGWGVWLQTVQITEVKISSRRLFEDLQAEFRQVTRIKAEKIQLQQKEQIEESRQNTDLKISSMNQENITKRVQNQNIEKLKREKESTQFQIQWKEMQLKKIESEKNFQIKKMKAQMEQKQEQIKNEQNSRSLEQDFELDFKKKMLEIDRLHDEKTLRKYEIDSTERIYNRLNIKDMRINQFVGDKSSLASLLPTVGYQLAQLKASQ